MKESIELVRFLPEYVPAIQEYASKQVNTRLTNVPYPYPVNGAQWFQMQCQEKWLQGLSREMVVLVDRQVAGMCGVLALDSEHPMVGYWLDESFWGRGIGTRAVRKLITYCFGELKLGGLFASVLKENEPSKQVLKKNDFRIHHLEKLSKKDPKFPAEMLEVYHLQRLY